MLRERSLLQVRRSILQVGLGTVLLLSTDHGLPKLISCIIDGLEEANDFYEQARRQKETAITAERCPAWMWQELRHHNPLHKGIYSKCYIYFLPENDIIIANTSI